MHESAPSREAVEPLRDLRERLLGWWHRTAAQAVLAARRLPQRTALHRPQATKLRRLPSDEHGHAVGANQTGIRDRSMRRDVTRVTSRTTTEHRPVQHASEIVALLRGSLVRSAARGRGALPGASSRSGSIRGDRVDRAADSNLARTLRALHAEPPPESDPQGAEFDSPSVPGALRWEAVDDPADRIEPPVPRESSLRERRWRELAEAQQELAEALVRLERRPSRWND